MLYLTNTCMNKLILPGGFQLGGEGRELGHEVGDLHLLDVRVRVLGTRVRFLERWILYIIERGEYRCFVFC